MAATAAKKVESTVKKVLRYTGYVATFGVSYLVRRNKKNKQQKKAVKEHKSISRQASVESLLDENWINAENLMLNAVAQQREEKFHQQTSQTDDVISGGEQFTSNVTCFQLVQEEMRVETSREMAESNNLHFGSENLMPKNDLSVHETEMSERKRAVSDIYNEIAELRTDLSAEVDAGAKKPRRVNFSYKQPNLTPFMTKVRNFMEESRPPEQAILPADLAAAVHVRTKKPLNVHLSYKQPNLTPFIKKVRNFMEEYRPPENAILRAE